MKLKDIGERNLIHGIFKDFKISQQKDDCAIIDNGDEVLLLSTDIIRESTHIPKGAKPRQIGKFAANINLSDIAAMAGQPVGMLVSYLLSPEMEEAKFREIVSGVNDALKAFDAEILGGDTKEGEETVISGTVLGKTAEIHCEKKGRYLQGPDPGSYSQPWQSRFRISFSEAWLPEVESH